jgi:hypothetical protein
MWRQRRWRGTAVAAAAAAGDQHALSGAADATSEAAAAVLYAVELLSTFSSEGLLAWALLAADEDGDGGGTSSSPNCGRSGRNKGGRGRSSLLADVKELLLATRPESWQGTFQSVERELDAQGHVVAAGDVRLGTAGALAEALAARGRAPAPVCANPACINMQGPSELELRLPVRCRGCGPGPGAAQYCGRECAVEHWRAGHKALCRGAAGGVSAGAAGAGGGD